ncbi:MAG: DUF3482 domain-containing protein [Myxococcota bacterium]|nr:DUF3482 domain-containing protein [Myxococcota bacterium]
MSASWEDEATAGGPEAPAFAVVGHPNKGKSSLVATLARDERVRIAPEPGTTTRAMRYPLRVEGETLYVLVDTPGFQRARTALAWLRAEAERTGASAADRPELVARFCGEPGHRERFPDEVELLLPIVAGAGILYVVDGSVPYGVEYEAEMEILRWTGRPSLAVINPIGGPTHVDAWRAALGQYFRVVRVLDALRADFDTRLDLLRTFGQLDDAWREPMERAVRALEADRRRRRERAAAEIARMLADAAALTVEARIPREEEPEAHRAELLERYQGELRRLERRGRRAVESVYDFAELDVEEGHDAALATERALLDEDLFARETWLVFGLRRSDLVTAGAAAGAAAGTAIDVAVGGASLLAGAALGGVVGGVLGWMGADRLAAMQVLRQPLGGQLLRMGPARAGNLAFVLLGRARLHHALVAGRTHARRDRRILLGPAEDGGDSARIPPVGRDAARRILAALRRPETAAAPLREEVERLLEEDAETARAAGMR